MVITGADPTAKIAEIKMEEAIGNGILGIAGLIKNKISSSVPGVLADKKMKETYNYNMKKMVTDYYKKGQD